MKLLSATVLLLMLSSVAIAAPDSQQLGPYTVSFDLNASYKTQIAKPIETKNASYYQISLYVNNSTFAIIEITEHTEPTDATLQLYKSILVPNMLIREGLNATHIEDKTIGGKEGFLITSVPLKTKNAAPIVVYRAMYWPDSEKCECGPVSVGRTSATITSTFQKDITESLLSSLKIEKGKAT